MGVRSITEAELSVYKRDGVAKLPKFVEPSLVQTLTVALDQQIANPSQWRSQGMHHSDRCFGLSDPELSRYLLDATLGQNAARAMESATARFYFDHMFLFEPNTPVEEHYWHQDQPYWPVQGEQIVSIWLSLTACTPDEAALKFVPGSQASTSFYRPQGFGGAKLPDDLGERAALAIDAADQFRAEEPPRFHEDVEGHGVVEWSYEAGDAVIFHSRVVHSSGGNRSPDRRRLAYSARFVGDDARQTLRAGVFQDPALLPDVDEPFEVGAPMVSRRWPVVYPSRS